jgi:ubiquinone/menaquinone biosynthesis C-methylase UbiE
VVQAHQDPYPGSFDDAEAYDRFIGKYSAVFAPQFVEVAGVEPGQRVLDVGCGPGAVASELVRRARPECVSALDPSGPFIAALSSRFPGVAACVGWAEALPYPDGEFDVVLAQLSVQFMADSAAGLAEMVRVTRPGGVVAVCDWGGRSRNPLDPFWQAAAELDLAVEPRTKRRQRWVPRPVAFAALGVGEIETTMIEAGVRYERFEDLWESMTEGVGPSAAYAKSLGDAGRARLREHLRTRFPAPPFVFAAAGQVTRGVVT